VSAACWSPWPTLFDKTIFHKDVPLEQGGYEISQYELFTKPCAFDTKFLQNFAKVSGISRNVYGPL
jgi:hypothetical protein